VPCVLYLDWGILLGLSVSCAKVSLCFFGFKRA
jgi:hypothetical protein